MTILRGNVVWRDRLVVTSAPYVGFMQAAVRPITPINPIPHALDAAPGTRVTLDGERIVVDRLVLHDSGLASFIAERASADRP